MKRLLSFLVSAAFLVCMMGLVSTAYLYAQRRPAPAKGPSVAWKAPTGAQPSDYAGEDTCKACHSAEAAQFDKSPHADIAPEGAKMGVGCESCHGPGAAHAHAEETAAGDPAKMEAGKKLIFKFDAGPKEDSERCLRCHSTGTPQDAFQHSVHISAGVSCNDCHSPHLLAAADAGKPKLQPAQGQFFSVPRLKEENAWLTDGLLKKPQPELCYSCHATVQAQFALPEHHRVPEGFMKCTDCHNPHGTMNHHQLNAPAWETCVKCHVEKRGPFLYEHAVVRVEGCAACHTPHGSVNNFLLARREQRLLCLQCHAAINGTSGFHGQANVPHGRGGYQTSGDCTRCHVAVHGSNFDEYLLR
jgi:predicted CXXCH cytochrome family protein